MDILEYWFENDDLYPTKGEMRKWFYNSKEYDIEIINKFPFTHPYSQTQTQTQTQRQIPDEILGHIIFYDQFSRHKYRGTQMAYAFDKIAQRLVIDNIELLFMEEDDRDVREGELSYSFRLSPKKMWFFLMPLHHAEDIDMQNMYEFFVNIMVEKWGMNDFFRKVKKYQVIHKDIIERHGCFPSRFGSKI